MNNFKTISIFVIAFITWFVLLLYFIDTIISGDNYVINLLKGIL